MDLDIDALTAAAASRANALWDEMTRRYPGAWRDLTGFADARGTRGDFPACPEWCWLPMAVSASVVSARPGRDSLRAAARDQVATAIVTAAGLAGADENAVEFTSHEGLGKVFMTRQYSKVGWPRVLALTSSERLYVENNGKGSLPKRAVPVDGRWQSASKVSSWTAG